MYFLNVSLLLGVIYHLLSFIHAKGKSHVKCFTFPVKPEFRKSSVPLELDKIAYVINLLDVDEILSNNIISKKIAKRHFFQSNLGNIGTIINNKLPLEINISDIDSDDEESEEVTKTIVHVNSKEEEADDEDDSDTEEENQEQTTEKTDADIGTQINVENLSLLASDLQKKLKLNEANTSTTKSTTPQNLFRRTKVKTATNPTINTTLTTMPSFTIDESLLTEANNETLLTLVKSLKKLNLLPSSTDNTTSTKNPKKDSKAVKFKLDKRGNIVVCKRFNI